jgi:hypothetical protein
MKTQSLGYLLALTGLEISLVPPSDRAKNWPMASSHTPETSLWNVGRFGENANAAAHLQEPAVFPFFRSHTSETSLLSTCCQPHAGMRGGSGCLSSGFKAPKPKAAPSHLRPSRSRRSIALRPACPAHSDRNANASFLKINAAVAATE